MGYESITRGRLQELLHYDPGTGIFTRRVGVKGAAAGSIAGCRNAAGYVFIGVDHQRPYAHRLAFLYMTGGWPSKHVDHLDGDKTNNRWSNLRDVSFLTNMQNLRKPRKSETRKSKYIGVSNNHGFSWSARIRVGSKNLYLGSFATEEDAAEAYIQAKRQMHAGNTL